MSFCGIFVYGFDRPFSLQESLPALRSFREFSAEPHPLYIFFAKSGDIEEACKLLGNVIPIQVSVMRSVRDYDEFMLHQCFHVVRYENTLTMHTDGHLLRAGWEDYAAGYDYLGASWHRHIPDFDFHYKNNAYAKLRGYEAIAATTTVGNGGFCFRKRSKMVEVEQSVDWSTKDGDWLPDDVFYSFYGFGRGILKPVSPEEADAWSEEPLREGKSIGFHSKNHTPD